MNTKLSISPLYSLDKILLLLVFLRIRRKEIFVFEPFCDSRQYYQFQEMCFDLVKRVIDDSLMLLVASNLVVEQDNFSFNFLRMVWLVSRNCIENYYTHIGGQDQSNRLNLMKYKIFLHLDQTLSSLLQRKTQ